MNPLANAKDPRNADVLHSDDADGKDAVAIESNILISYNFTNKHKKAQAANREVFSSNKRSQTVCWGWRGKTLCFSPPAGQLI